MEEPTAATETPPEEEREQHVVAYEAILTEAECQKLKQTARVLETRVDPYVHVWVHDARSFAHDRESSIAPFTLRLHPLLPIAEIRDLVEDRFAASSGYSADREGPLNLCFEGCVLENGRAWGDYHTVARSSSWAKPFAGIVFVVPFRSLRSSPVT